MPSKLFFFLVILFANSAFSQSINSNWYFGNKAGITFNSGLPQPLGGSMMNQEEGTATVSDPRGKLLFYTDGVTIWNKNHAVMQNGTGLLGDNTTTQSALIVPMPGSTTKYYVFTLPESTDPGGELSYSIVDMSFNGGLGKVDLAAKNIVIANSETEKLVAANGPGCGVWVITHRRNNVRFEARLITNTGIAAPVYSNEGSYHTNFAGYDDFTGTMKVSNNNQKIGLAALHGKVELFDFDPITGIVSNWQSLLYPNPLNTYGVCFSPDDSKLYVSQGYNNPTFKIEIYQYDLSLANPTDIFDSRKLVASFSTIQWIVSDMKTGPDGRLYVAVPGHNYLAVIPDPNLVAPNCGFILNGIDLPPGMISQIGLPNEVRTGLDPLRVFLGNDTAICAGSGITLTANAGSTFVWSTGQTTQSIFVIIPGKYWVNISDGSCVAVDTINVTIRNPVLNLGIDTSICPGLSMILKAGKGFASYLWQDGSTDSTLTISAPGIYSIRVQDVCGTILTDTINVTPRINTINIGPDKTKCNGDTVQITAPPGFLNYSWSNNYNINTLNAQSVLVHPLVDTAYYIKAEKTPGCFAFDTVKIKVNHSPVINLGQDKSFCQVDSAVFDAGPGFNSFLWSNGRTSQSVVERSVGSYTVKATTVEGCNSFDTIQIITIYQNPVLNLVDQPKLCAGTTRTIDAGSFASYLWNDGSVLQTITVNNTGSYFVTVWDPNGCRASDTTIINALLPSPTNFLPGDTAICSYETIQLVPANTYSSYLWNTNITSPSITVSQPGLYWLELQDNNGCTGRDSIRVNPKTCIEGFYIPNAFTPNGDGKNDVFGPKLLGVVLSYHFVIYNQWGNKVFESFDVHKGWDGSKSGVGQESNVFVWICEYQLQGEAVRRERGIVVLIR